MNADLNTKAVEAIIKRINSMTPKEVERLDAAENAAWTAAWYSAWDAAWDTALAAAKNATRHQAWTDSSDAVRDVILAMLTFDLATEDGPYTIAQRDLLLAPWVSVFGLPEDLDGEA